MVYGLVSSVSFSWKLEIKKKSMKYLATNQRVLKVIFFLQLLLGSLRNFTVKLISNHQIIFYENCALEPTLAIYWLVLLFCYFILYFNPTLWYYFIFPLGVFNIPHQNFRNSNNFVPQSFQLRYKKTKWSSQ